MKLTLVRVKDDLPVTERGYVINKDVPDDQYWRHFSYKPGETYFVIDSYFDPARQWEVVSPQRAEYWHAYGLLKEHCDVLSGPLAWWRALKKSREPQIVCYLEALEKKRMRRRLQFEHMLANRDREYSRQMAVIDALEKLGDI